MSDQDYAIEVVENKETMRLQLLFDRKPEEDARNILKAYGFRWAPKHKAWQRFLTNKAKNAANVVLQLLASGKPDFVLRRSPSQPAPEMDQR